METEKHDNAIQKGTVEGEKVTREKEDSSQRCVTPLEGSSNGSSARLSTLKIQWVLGMNNKLTHSPIQLASPDTGIIDVDHRSAPPPYAVQVKTHGTCQYRNRKKKGKT